MAPPEPPEPGRFMFSYRRAPDGAAGHGPVAVRFHREPRQGCSGRPYIFDIDVGVSVPGVGLQPQRQLLLDLGSQVLELLLGHRAPRQHEHAKTLSA